jgi:hypothetical protein
MVYGDFEFCLVEVIPNSARLWRWRGLGERDFWRGSNEGHTRGRLTLAERMMAR